MVGHRKIILLFVACLLSSAGLGRSHVVMTKPRIRGALAGTAEVKPALFPDAPIDWSSHFPAGDKDISPGAGLRSQQAAAGPGGWYPYDPTDPNFRFRAGLCGDLTYGEQAHMRGGEFYYDGQIVETYKQGGTFEIELQFFAVHNGYIELRICDVDKCGGEISHECFIQGHCQVIPRAKNNLCDGGKSMDCGPIDSAHPGRWHLPCSRADVNFFGGKYAVFQLPENLVCEHCVIQLYWPAMNSCIIEEVENYFTGPDGPDWGTCPGQGGAIGGYVREQKPCDEPGQFSEEYYQCADVAITARNGAPPVSTETEKPEEPTAEPIPDSTDPPPTEQPTSTPVEEMTEEPKVEETPVAPPPVTPPQSGDECFQEVDGRIVVQAELAKLTKGWSEQTALQGFTGSGYVCYEGPNMYTYTGESVLEYPVDASGGDYEVIGVVSRPSVPGQDIEWDENNDMFVFNGDDPVKLFANMGSEFDEWTTTSQFDFGSTKADPIISIPEGTTKVRISGRSTGFCVDYIELVKVGSTKKLDGEASLMQCNNGVSVETPIVSSPTATDEPTVTETPQPTPVDGNSLGCDVAITGRRVELANSKPYVVLVYEMNDDGTSNMIESLEPGETKVVRTSKELAFTKDNGKCIRRVSMSLSI